MKIKSLKVEQTKIVASVEEGGMIFDVTLPSNLASFKSYVEEIKKEVAKRKNSQLIVELQSLVGVDLLDDVAVFAATKDAPASVGKLLEKPAKPAEEIVNP